MEKVSKALRIVAMSDTHDTHQQIDISKLPDGDIFIHAGDFTLRSYRGEMDRFREFLKKLPYKHKIVIAGNHDFVLDHKEYAIKHKPRRHPSEKMSPENEIQKLKEVCTYLDHQSVQIEGIKIFGSPYQPLYYNWGFQYHESRAEDIWSAIPESTDILVTHGPPYGILDSIKDGTHIGCPTLLKYVQKIKPRINIFGHVHQSSGSVQIDQTRFYNVAVLNQAYQLTKAPLVIIY